MAKSPNKKELARMKALSEMGESTRSIGRRLNRDHSTIARYLKRTDLYDNPEMQALISTIKERELADLYLLGAKARNRLHDILDEGKTKAIETTAVMDRSFQQRRLLEGMSTQNVSIRDVAVKLDQDIREMEAELKALEGEGKQ